MTAAGVVRVTMSRQGASIEAIECVYRERGAGLFRFALARLGDRDLAHDAVQEGFVRALRSRHGFRRIGSLEGWIARCVANAAHDLATGTSEMGVPLDVEAPSESLPDQSVRQEVRRLPPRQRDALFLRYYLDFDYATIATVLGIEVGTVSATLHAAHERLASALQEVSR